MAEFDIGDGNYVELSLLWEEFGFEVLADSAAAEISSPQPH
jgi:hypothetical protein